MPYKSFPSVVNNLPLFSGISEEERDGLLREGKLRQLAKGEYLFHQGDPIPYFYIICSGNMQMLRDTPDGKAITTQMKPRGKTIGKADILLGDSSHHRVSACAIDDVVLLEFPASWLRNIAKNPVISLNILTRMSQYAHMIEVESEQKNTMNGAQRVGCFLQRLRSMHGLDAEKFELPYAKALIASRLGMEPETFSRALANLKDHGVRLEKSSVRFYDMRALESYTCSHCSMNGECSAHKKNMGFC